VDWLKGRVRENIARDELMRNLRDAILKASE